MKNVLKRTLLLLIILVISNSIIAQSRKVEEFAENGIDKIIEKSKGWKPCESQKIKYEITDYTFEEGRYYIDIKFWYSTYNFIGLGEERNYLKGTISTNSNGCSSIWKPKDWDGDGVDSKSKSRMELECIN